jgi:hypothetical protein
MRARLKASIWQVWSSHKNAVRIPFVSLTTFPLLTTLHFVLKDCDRNSDGMVGRMNSIGAENCMLACPGNSAEICGGASGIVVYVAP